MTTFTIYTTKSGSYIVPKDKANLPKSVIHIWEIDSPVEICNKKCKLPARVTKVDELAGIVKRLVVSVKDS